MWMMRTGCAVIAAAGISFASATADAADDSALAFYRGKQIRFFTMGSPGGGYDAYTRTVGSFLERKLDARVLPTNEPAAGGMIAMNRTVNALPDGLTAPTGGECSRKLAGRASNTMSESPGWRGCRARTKRGAGAPSPYQTVSEMQKSGTDRLGSSGKADNNPILPRSCVTCSA